MVDKESQRVFKFDPDVLAIDEGGDNESVAWPPKSASSKNKFRSHSKHHHGIDKEVTK